MQVDCRRVGLEHPRRRLGRHGLTEEVALIGIATDLTQELKLGLGLDTLGHQVKP